MQDVPIENLMSRIHSTYKLAILTFLRAIELSEGAARLVDAPQEEKTINVALKEISEGKISYKIRDSK